MNAAARARRPKIEGLPLDAPAALALRSMLKNRHRGEERARPKPKLLEDLAGRGYAIDRRVLDETLRAMRREKWPVCATDKGVFWAIRRDEVAKARHYVSSRFEEIRETCEAYDRIYADWGHVELPGEPLRDGQGQGLFFDGAGRRA